MTMTLDEYQVATRETASYPKITAEYIYPVLGLSGEVGELTNKVSKIFRDDKGELTEERRQSIKGELGDILWFLARTADEFGYKLSEIGESNIERLRDRKKRNMISGSGDNR